MCGIAGCYNVDKAVDREKFEEAVDIISYRGPDDRGGKSCARTSKAFDHRSE